MPDTALDMVIRGGTVVDGTGAPARRADVGIAGGRIVAVGKIGDDAAQVIDAGDLVVAPGFVDPHTHYDAQLFWDPAASPSNLHGVTSVIAGNCGFTLAPLDPDDADYLRRMMAKVEGMPLPALETGVPWQWRSFSEYLGALDGNVGLNVGFLVGHCALRRNVMGADATEGEATPEQQEAMVRLLHDSLEAGGIGFSTTLSFTHSDGDGKPVASRWASKDEVLALCAAVSDHEGTTLEYVTDGCLRGFSDAEVEMMAEMTLAGRRALNWNVLTIDSREPERYRDQLAACENAFERGGKAVALTMPISRRDEHVVPQLLRVVHAARLERSDEPAGAGRVAKLKDPSVRQWMNDRARSPEAGVFSRLASWGRYMIGDTYSAANAGLKGQVVAEIAERANRGTFDTLARHRHQRRLVDRALAAPVRWRPEVVADAGGGVGPSAGDDRRFRRRRASRPHVRCAVHDVVPRRFVARPPTRVARTLRAADDVDARTAVRPARARGRARGVPRRLDALRPGSGRDAER